MKTPAIFQRVFNHQRQEYVLAQANSGNHGCRRPCMLILMIFILGILTIASSSDTERWEKFIRGWGGYFLDDTSLEATREHVLEEEQVLSEKQQSEALPRTSTRDYHNFTLDLVTKYFIYSPSGGFNNQRIELEYALIIARILKRTLIVPPMGKHSSFFGRYELLTPAQMVPMDRIFDFEKLAEFQPLIPMGNERIITYVKQLEAQGYGVKIIYHPDRRNWKEKDVISYMGNIGSKVLFLRGAEMFHPWGFNKQYSHKMYHTVRFTEGIRAVALNVIDNNFPRREYNAVHIRVGDYADRVPSMGVYMRQMAQRGFTKEVPLYVATEPSTPKTLFKELCATYNCKFSKDLESEELRRFGAAIPQGQIRADMMGVIEQLVGVGAKHFLGTYFSTFSAKITQMRKLRSFSFPEFSESEEEKSRKEAGDDDVESLDDQLKREGVE